MRSHRDAPARRRAGFTLLEVLIALSILGVGLLGLAVMQLQAMSGTRSGRHQTQAAVIARDQLESFMSRTFTDPALAATVGFTAPVVVTNTVEGAMDQDEQTYRVSWQISDVVATWVKEIDVVVSWDEPNRPNRSVTVSTRRYNDPW